MNNCIWHKELKVHQGRLKIQSYASSWHTSSPIGIDQPNSQTRLTALCHMDYGTALAKSGTCRTVVSPSSLQPHFIPQELQAQDRDLNKVQVGVVTRGGTAVQP